MIHRPRLRQALLLPLVLAGAATVMVAGGGGAAGAPQPTATATATPTGKATPSPTASPTPKATPASKATPTPTATPKDKATTIQVAPPNPTEAAKAQAAARAAAKHVALLKAQLTSATKLVTTSGQVADAAQGRVDAQLTVERRAAAAAKIATANARVTQLAYDRDHAAFVNVITAQYEAGEGLDVVSTVGHLLLAQHPQDLIDAAQDEELVQQYISGVLDSDRAATDANQAAQQARVAALTAQRQASANLGKLRDASQGALSTATEAATALRTGLTTAQANQAQADAALSTFLGGWAISDPARAQALNQKYLEAAQLPPTGKLTHGEKAARRALLQIDTPYAWAGGNGAGPTQGLCVGGGAENDCHVIGFDCSGLTLFGWAPFVGLPHLAAAQYSIAGSVHPAITELMPGDLVFWSSDGQVAGIHHVALYVGDGNVVQAPQSGDIVRVTPLGSVDSGYYGATRPGS